MAPYALEAGAMRLLAADHVAPEVARGWLACPPRESTTLAECSIGTVRFKPGKYRRDARAFALGAALAEAGAPVSSPLGLLIARQSLFARPSWLILRHEPGIDLHALLLHGLHAGERYERARLWRAIARAVAALHSAGFRQRDLKAPNILVDWPAPREIEPRILLLDLDGMRRCRRGVPARLRRADLGRLAASFSTPEVRAAGVEPRDWSAVLSEYLAAIGAPRQDLAPWEEVTQDLAERKLRRNARLGRPTA